MAPQRNARKYEESLSIVIINLPKTPPGRAELRAEPDSEIGKLELPRLVLRQLGGRQLKESTLSSSRESR